MTGRHIGGSTFYGPRGAAYSSATDDWATPPHVFAALDRDFGFELDVCASASNAKCSRYFTREDDGLAQEWVGVVWCNPPYGRGIGDWLTKAADSADAGATVVCLIPAKTETLWWHEQVMARASEVKLVKGRIAFGDGTGSSTFGSAVVVYRPGRPRQCPDVPDFSAWSRPEKPRRRSDRVVRHSRHGEETKSQERLVASAKPGRFHTGIAYRSRSANGLAWM